jgi:hypothetical protein
MWGTYWQWADARLVSELVLLFLYLGYMLLRTSFDDRDKGDRIGAILAVVGVVNVPIIHFSVEWWKPVRGFGMVWRDSPGLRNALGWAYTHETLHTTRYEYHVDGELVGGEFEQASGEYHIDSLFQYTLVLNEEELRAPCDEIEGTWHID